jgi:hypothetical protein
MRVGDRGARRGPVTPGTDPDARAPRLISSRLTVFYKFVFPVLWIGLFAVITAAMFIVPDERAGDLRDLRWVFAAVTVVGAAFVYWFGMRLKRVALGERSMIVSNYVEEADVPLIDVERVSGSVLLSPELVWIHLRRPSTFGQKIVFMPTMRMFHGFSRHPIVAELQQVVENARS